MNAAFNDLAQMENMIRQARASNADLVVFPERAISEAALPQLQAVARAYEVKFL